MSILFFIIYYIYYWLISNKKHFLKKYSKKLQYICKVYVFIDKLNEDQPKDDFEKIKRFPIVFSKNFKNSLTHSQRLALCDLFKINKFNKSKCFKKLYKKKYQ